jgi:hypothetical protein
MTVLGKEGWLVACVRCAAAVERWLVTRLSVSLDGFPTTGARRGRPRSLVLPERGGLPSFALLSDAGRPRAGGPRAASTCALRIEHS